MKTFSRRQVVKGIAVSVPLAPLLTVPFAAGAQTPQSGDITITTAGGRKAMGVLAMPAKTPAPAILLIHEWWGLNRQMRATAVDYSRKGYIVLAADLYGGRVADNRDDAKAYTSAVDKEAATDEVASWIRWLKKHPAATGKVATVGYCFGGGWSLNASIAEPVDATVIFYGDVTKKADQLSSLKGPVLGNFAGQDRRINHAMVALFEAEMKKAGKTVTSNWYDAAHAFSNYESSRFDEKSAVLSAQRTMKFLKANLGGQYTQEGAFPSRKH